MAIYLILNKINGKRYIGKSKNITARWTRHKYNAKIGIITYLYKAIRKYRPENFVIEFLCEGDYQEEIKQIELLKPEYNMTSGGEGGDTSNSPRYIAAMDRIIRIGKANGMWGKKGINNPNFGKKRSQKQKLNSQNSEYVKSYSRQIRLNGVVYPSIEAARRAHNKSHKWVRKHGEFLYNDKRTIMDRTL
jgi:group I intron endonuclease